MAILLFLLAGYVGRSTVEGFLERWIGTSAGALSGSGPLPASNAISTPSIRQLPDKRIEVEVEYAYTGEPKNALIRIFQVVSTGGRSPVEWLVGMQKIEPGTGRVAMKLSNPSQLEASTASRILAKLEAWPSSAIASSTVEFAHSWPHPVQAEVTRAIEAGTQDAVVSKAADLIDSGSSDEIAKARTLLQKLVESDPKAHAAYVELARIAMRTNGNPAGLREAQSLLDSALQIAPDSVNAKILLGFVYAHQGRLNDAEPLFAEAARTDPPNLWLWANWGELLAMQGKTQAAIEKYQEALRRPPTRNTYDRARQEAYTRLLQLLEERNQADQIFALTRQRAAEYPGYACFTVQWAGLKAVHEGDAAGARAVLRDVPSPICADSTKREVEGVVRYMLWAENSGPDKADLLRQARAFAPVSPALFYWLARGDNGIAAAKALAATGEGVSVQDNEKWDALSYALRNRAFAVAGRLLRAGANPLAVIGDEQMPAALIPVLNGDVEGVRLLRRAGVDYTKLKYQGVAAADIARQRGDKRLIQLIDGKADAI